MCHLVWARLRCLGEAGRATYFGPGSDSDVRQGVGRAPIVM